MLLPKGLPFLLCLGAVRGFLPNRESRGITPSDFTDADITEMGVLRAVASYMEKNPLPGKPPMAPGELENMTPLNATGLFKAYFQADVSSSRLVKAIQEIIVGNNQVELHHKEDSSYFFYCEEITKSIVQLRNLRDSVLSGLKGSVSSSDLESARLNTGKALHILQKFYSSTNWVEMGNSKPYEHLLNPASRAFPAAPASKHTCRDCAKPPGSGWYICDDNMLVNDMLTSGYKLSGSCRTKPKGKCGHGGRTDATQNFSPKGGINKETSQPQLSPHYHLHKEAAELAIQATRDFFVADGFGLLDQVGKEIFQKFFSLEGYSLTFAIDTTGSMSDDIAQVKTTAINLLRKYSGSPDAPHNYVLVPFNDPDVGPVQKTNNVDQLESYISSLKATGGGDCPEMSLTGLKLALQESLPRSKIFSFTDAGAKDAALKDEIKVLVDSSGSEVSYALTGYCDSRKRRSVPEPATSRRSFANLYEELAAYSGGYYVMTTKSQLSQILGIMELSLNAAPVTVAHSRLDGTQFSFPVDETLTELSVSVKSLSSSGFSMTVQQPSGAPSGAVSTVINTNSHKVVKVSSINVQGSWSVVVSPSGSYEVEIGGKSLLDFSYQIMQEHDEYMLPIQGRPVKGSDYTVSIKLMGEAGGIKVQRMVALSELGVPIDSISLNQTSDALGNPLATALMALSAPATLLMVEGLSPRGFPFSRVNADPVSTESVQIVSLPNQNITTSPGKSLAVSVAAVNDGATASFSFNVQDDMGFLRSFTPTGAVLNPGQNITLTATFVPAVDSSTFAASIATFTAKSSSAQNYLKLPITVIPEVALETDETPPIHKLLDFYMPCVGKFQQQPTCSRHSWAMRFFAMDAQSTITLRAKPNPSGLSCRPQGTETDNNLMCLYSAAVGQGVRGSKFKLPLKWVVWVQSLSFSIAHYPGFVMGSSGKEKRASSDCCSPYAEVVISDENGNSDTIALDYRRSRPPAAA